MMRIVIVFMWFIWLIPAFMYIFWKRGDWYLFIFPPLVVSVIALAISVFSEIIAIISIILIHVIMLFLFWRRKQNE